MRLTMNDIRVWMWAVVCVLGRAALAEIPYEPLPAPPAPRHVVDAHGNLFLGGQTIELAITGNGSLGPTAPRPPAMIGTAFQASLGLSADLDGFGRGVEMPTDYFLAGRAEERWSVGFINPSDVDNAQVVASASAREETSSLVAAGNASDESDGPRLRGTVENVVDERLRVTQTFSFDDADDVVVIDVRIENIGDVMLTDVRYLRSIDPDNTAQRGGSFLTENQVLRSRLAGDAVDVVCAQTFEDGDPIFIAYASRAPLCFATADARGRVSRLGLNSGDPFSPLAFDTPAQRGVVSIGDERLAVTFAFGVLAPGATVGARFLLTLDPRPPLECLDNWSFQLEGPLAPQIADATLPHDNDNDDDAAEGEVEPNHGVARDIEDNTGDGGSEISDSDEAGQSVTSDLGGDDPEEDAPAAPTGCSGGGMPSLLLLSLSSLSLRSCRRRTTSRLV